MKNIRHLLIIFLLSVGAISAMAQQWSDVGNQGFTPTPFGVVENQPDMIVVGTTPYMAYVTNGNQIVVMKYTGGTWTALPTVATSGQTPDLAADNSGTLYITYQNSGAANVKKFDGTNWVFVGSASLNNALGITGGSMPRIAIDPVTNAPFIVFLDATNSVNAAKFNGTAWVIAGQQDFLVGTFPRIAISSAGVPFVSIRSNVGFISVSKFDGTNWVAVGASGFTTISGLYSDIAVDGAGVPYTLSTEFASPARSTVFKFNGTAWVVVGAQSFTSSDVRYAQLKFSNAGVLHIVYTNGSSSSRANVMKFDGANWVAVGTINFSSALAQTPSLAFDNSDVMYVGYGDGSFSNAGTVMKLCAASTASILTTTPATICNAPATTTLSATANTSSLKWYSTVGLQLGTGTSYTTPSLSATTTYAVAAYDANGCSSPRTNVVATVSTTPTVLSTNGGGVCVGNAAGVSATVSAGTVSWYTVPTGGVPLATNILNGSTYTTPIINTTTTFYAEAVNNGCVSTTRTAVTPTVVQRPANPVAVDGSRCGPGIVSLSVTSEPGTVQWFTASTGGTLLQASGNTYNTLSISATTTYYADVTVGGCVSLARTPVVAVIKSFPTVTSTTPATRCGTGTVTLTATLSDEGGINWYTATSGGSPVGTNSFTTPSITVTTTYYAEAVANGCSSVSRTPVLATIKPIPTITAPNVSRCGPGTVALTATSDGTMSWFAAATGGSALTSGGNFTTPSLTATTPYFIEATLNGCTTLTRTSVSAVVNPIPALPTITADNSNVAAPLLTSSSSSGNQWFRNDVSISGATNTTYTITQEGTYKVQVTLLGCVSAMSAGQAFVITGAEGFEPNQVQLYPNPAADELVLNLSGFKPKESVGIVIVDLLGRQTKVAKGVGGEEVHIDIREITSGQYIAVMEQGNQRVAKLFVKKI
jgi:hypothetical protein